MEIWRSIPGYEKYYEVSSKARVKSLHRNSKDKIMTAYMRRGNLCVVLSKKGKFKHERLHRLFALAFCPNPHNKPWACPLDGNYGNITVDNIVWATPAEARVIARNFEIWKEVLQEIKLVNNNHISLKNLISDYNITNRVATP